ncbi:hypothetical protein PN462_13370 [Spirulina sp. CS-785/01]|uniref:DUF3226 domain-containing protein n=1 Tax=Spirulina sp. CS-785/01 TaxID=3021716 RepID=UPI0023314B07|nr:DUF3226 domain-containing protein [Spirulina sp. CS-785/01]MDB9314095.1 hypothetical protein [Spirulina sp. CS-785/01]
MSDICKQDTDKVLLVEGDNDCHVVMALCAAHNVPEVFGIYQCGSDIGVLKRLNALIVRPNPPQVIGVLLDADQPSTENNSLAARWQSIQTKLRHYHYIFPTVPDVNGTIIQSQADEPKLGVWLMPNNQDSGMLENFCAELANPTALAFAEDCVQQARLNDITTFKAVHQSKAVIHTYLAWQDEPGYPLGKAITKKSLHPQTEIAERFTNWLIRLFT